MKPQPCLVDDEPMTPPTSGDLGSLLVERGRALTNPLAVLGSMVETVWGLSHLAVYPFGTIAPRRGGAGHRYRMEHLSPLQRGMVDNHSIFAVLRRRLERRGFSRVYSMNYSVRTSDVRTAAAQLAAEVEQICTETGYERIHVVAHSLGGLIARYYATRLGGDDRVHTVVTLGSPHHGTHMARLLPLRIARQLRPGSPLLRELDQPAPGCTTRFVCFWSDTDEAILPARNAQLRHPDLSVTQVALTGVGHLSLPILPSVAHRISTSLTQLDNDGAPTASVTSIAPA